jgi:benzoyl-CoA reductase subunit C
MSKPVFEDWRGQDLAGILMVCRQLLEDMDFPSVKAWRENGGKVVGHFQVYFPEEIAHAAGMLPVKVRGAQVEARQADARFGSYLCSIIKTSLELALSGRLELDMFVSHPICDAARNLAAIWGRNFDYPSQILYLPQNANSSHSVEYLKAEYQRLLSELEDISGKKVTENDLRTSLEVFNTNRKLIRELYAIKKQSPWLISAEDAYILVAVGGVLPREEHNDILKAVLPLVEQSNNNKQDKIRIVFEGGFCEQPPLELLHDLLIGLRYISEDVPLDGEPLQNLAQAYLEQSSYSPVQHDHRKPKEKMLVERITAAGADAAIVTAAKMCEPGLEEQVTYGEALSEEKIPYFISEFEENMTSFDHLEIQLETFAENILFS